VDDLLFDIPIYLRSSEEYENERQQAENREKESFGGDHAFGKRIKIVWPPWEYNDIIGYYKIVINSSANPGGSINGIRVEKYIVNKKRISRHPSQRKVIMLHDPWFHKQLPAYYDQDHDFKNTLLRVLDELYEALRKRKRKPKRYYIEVEYYKNLIECTDFYKFSKILDENKGLI